MIVKAYYANGRIDVFDTDCMTDCMPQPGNLLTNYSLDLSDAGNECLWLRSYYYEAADVYKNETGPVHLPVARRRDGWSFLIADADDLQEIHRITLDGETVLVSVMDELIDTTALNWAWDLIKEYAPKAIVAHQVFTAIQPSDVDAGLLGMSGSAFGVLCELIPK